MRSHRLPERFFYWFPLSVLAWIRLCASKRYGHYLKSLTLCQQAAVFLTQRIQRKPHLQWISLGCGQGTKEVPFLRHSLRKGLSVDYIPWDSSQTLLEMACRRSLKLGIPTMGLKADLENPIHWRALPPRSSGSVRILSVFGNTLGAIGLDRFLAQVGKVLQRGDWFLLDGELFSGEETLKAYDHPVNRAFAFAPLKSIGLSSSDGRIELSLHPPLNNSPVGQVRKSFLFLRHVSIPFSGRRLSFRRGERILMSPSDKYDPERLEDRLTRRGRFCLEERFLSPDRRFALWVCRKV